MLLRTLLSIALGAALGYAYHRVVGCRTGACPITANPWASAIYGGVMGLLLSGGPR
jgi:hypothetical protein